MSLKDDVSAQLQRDIAFNADQTASYLVGAIGRKLVESEYTITEDGNIIYDGILFHRNSLSQLCARYYFKFLWFKKRCAKSKVIITAEDLAYVLKRKTEDYIDTGPLKRPYFNF